MKKIIGYVGVDSGQVLICDPCYIDSEWKKEDFEDIRKFQHKSGKIIAYPIDFPHFEHVIPEFGKTANQMVDDVELIPIEEKVIPKNNFSYNACCQLTLSKDQVGQLNYNMGHAGVGVVSSSGWGDGTYPVVAEFTKDNRVKSLTITFIGEDK